MADITVQLPNGSSIVFPEGTPPEKIKEVARRASGGPQRSGAEEMRARGLSSPNPSAANAAAEGDLSAGLAEGFVQENPALSRLSSAAAGLPFVGEWTDEAIGAIDPQAGERVRNAQTAMQMARPGQDMALRAAGGIVGSLPALAAAGPAVVAAAPASLGMRTAAGLGAGLAAGATEGAISGYGRGQGGERFETARDDAVVGGLLGGGLGAGGPLVADGVKAAFHAFKGSDVAAIADGLGISAPAARAVKAALEGDDLSRAAQNLDRGGDAAMLMEATPATRALASATSASGGRATTIVQNAVDDRMRGGAAAVKSALDDATKPGTAVIPMPPKLGTLYDAAYAKPIDYSSEAGQWIEALSARVPKEEWAKARRLIEMDPDVPEDIKRQFLVSIAEDGTRTDGTLPSVLELDYVTRSLNDTAKAGDGKGALGGNTNQGRLYGKLAKRIRSGMKEAVPEYKQALDFASTEIGIKEARDFGATMLRPGVTRADVLEQLKDAPTAELQAAKAAVRQALDDTLANTRRIMSRAGSGAEVGEAIKAVKDLSTRASRDKLATVLGRDEARKLTDALDEASTAFEIGAALSRNSDTAVRQAVQETVKAGASPNLVQRIAQGEPVGAMKRLTQIFTGQTPEAQAAQMAGIYEELANVLTTIKGPNARRALTMIEQARQGQPLTNEQAKHLAHMTVKALGAAGYGSGQAAFEGGF